MAVAPGRNAGVDTEEIRVGTNDKREDAEEEATPNGEHERDGQGKARGGLWVECRPEPGS